MGQQVRWRLVAPITLFLLLSSLDRVNISFAALGMNGALGLSPSQYGFGSGVLFVGFLAGQYPSVLLLQSWGMRRWLSACAILWGLSAGALAWVHTAPEFYLLRIVVGIAEAGLAPGVVLYLSQFTTVRQRAATFGVPMIAIPLSVALGSPLSAWLMSRSPGGMAPWRWLLIAEALPTLIVGVVARFYFPDTPRAARSLNADQTRQLGLDAAADLCEAPGNDWRVLASSRVWIAAALWFCLLSGSYGVIFWLPQVIRALSHLDTVQIGFVNALPWVGAALGMYINSMHSDRSGERYHHVGVPALFAAGATLLAWQTSGAAALGALVLLGLGLGAAQGAFWALPTAILTRRTLAVAAVAINICGSAGGLVMPHLIGLSLQRHP
ncbi:MAG TPA: MFS transporter, partial [Steroidobacteraceae bacterium]|nr:MFS transporter [Steroidobacteraceae bacterium]